MVQRSVGVTISAIVVLLGSLWTLVPGILAVQALVSPRPNFPNYPEGAKGFLLPLVFLLPAAWGITTSIGLFRLRNWGRISIIIFAATLMPIFVLVSWVFWPLFLAITIWWLVFFNLAHVKAQFMLDNLKPKEPLLAVMLTIILTGLGQVYAGRVVRGVLFFSVPFLGIILSALYFINPNTSLSIYALVPLAVLMIFYVWVILDAYRCAKSYNAANNLVRKISGWKKTILIIGIILFVPFYNSPFWIEALAVADYIKSNIAQAFLIPTGAMEPTIQIGDRVLVDKAIYKKSKPQRGDLIVFKYPLNPRRKFLKRLIALDGETVEIREGHVYINDMRIAETGYTIKPDFGNYGPVTVPASQYFVLGDNRNNSEDSRFFGFVPSENVLGKVYKIYWPLTRSGKVE